MKSLLALFTFTLILASCSKDEIPIESNHTEENSLEYTRNFISTMEDYKTNQILSRSTSYYSDGDATASIENGLNHRYSYPWHKHVNLDIARDTFVVAKSPQGISQNDLAVIYQEIEDFFACHYSNSSLPNKEPRAYDLYHFNETSGFLSIGATSVVGSQIASGPSPQSFASGDEFHAISGTCGNPGSGPDVKQIYTNYINFNLTPNTLVASDDPSAFNIINVEERRLGIIDENFGWNDINSSDLTSNDNLKDYNTWRFGCIDNNVDGFAECTGVYYDSNGDLTMLGEETFCLKNNDSSPNTENDLELDFYLGNMQSSILSQASFYNKEFVSTVIGFNAISGNGLDLSIGRSHNSKNLLGTKQFNVDPKSLLTSCP